MAEKHLVKHWRGKRTSYNFLKNVNRLDPWTRYSVIEDDGSIVEYFGNNLISVPTGQLLPVNAIVSGEPETNSIRPYDRYLVGTDETGYKVIEYSLIDPYGESGYTKTELTFDEKYGVRVKSEGLKNYVYVNDGNEKKLKTYDDVDCGTF